MKTFLPAAENRTARSRERKGCRGDVQCPCRGNDASGVDKNLTFRAEMWAWAAGVDARLNARRRWDREWSGWKPGHKADIHGGSGRESGGGGRIEDLLSTLYLPLPYIF